MVKIFNTPSFTSIIPIRAVYIAPSGIGIPGKDGFELTKNESVVKSANRDLKRILLQKDSFERKNKFIESSNKAIRQLMELKIKDYFIKPQKTNQNNDIGFITNKGKFYLLTGEDSKEKYDLGATIGRTKANLQSGRITDEIEQKEAEFYLEKYNKDYSALLKNLSENADYSKQLTIYGIKKKLGGIKVLNVNF